MKTTKANFFVTAAPLLLVLFIDGMGLSLVFPILNGLIFDSNSTFLAATGLDSSMHHVIYGAVIAIFMLCWFFGAAVLGDLSDQIGRKKSLLICLVGTFISYILSAIAVVSQSLTLLIIGRVIAGFSSGSQPIAQASIVDLSKPEDKARNLGFVLLAISCGFIFGPFLGGILSDKTIVSWFDFATPFYFAAIISFANMLLLMVLFHETFVLKATGVKIKLHQAIHIFISAFKHEKIRNLSILFFVFIFGWSSFYSFVSLFLLKVYAFTPANISFFMAVVGIGFGVGTGFLVNYCTKRFPLRENFIYSTCIGAILIFVMLLFDMPWVSWLLVAPLACSVACAYTFVLTFFSNEVDDDAQGWVMGITGSIMALVWAINAVVVGALAMLDATLPMYVAAITLLAAGLFPYILSLGSTQLQTDSASS